MFSDLNNDSQQLDNAQHFAVTHQETQLANLFLNHPVFRETIAQLKDEIYATLPFQEKLIVIKFIKANSSDLENAVKQYVVMMVFFFFSLNLSLSRRKNVLVIVFLIEMEI